MTRALGERLSGGTSLLALALLIALPAASFAAPPPARITLDDVVAMLKAGIGEKVILAQLEATGTELKLTVEGLLELKAAGASDALLERLVQPDWDRREGAATDSPPPARASVSGEHPFRVYRETTGDGEEVMHITNLDASGKRIGGELKPEERIPANVVHPSPESPPRPERRYEEEEPQETQSPVVVNIYSDDTFTPRTIGSLHDDRDLYGPSYYHGRYHGWLGGFYPVHRHGRHCGHHLSHYRPYISPPGSYTHFLRYHHPDVLDTAPYTHGTAASRNRTYFRR